MDNLNAVIDNLCQKLGTTVEFLIPEYAKMKIAEAWSALIVTVIFIMLYPLYWVILSKFKKKGNDVYDMIEEFEIIGFIIGVLVIAALILVCVSYIPVIFKYSTSPSGAFFDEIIKSVNK